MKLDILQLYGFRLPTTSAFKQDFVIQPESELGHSGQVDPHFDSTYNFTSKDMTICICL